MSTTQRVMWTACPDGVAANGQLRVSVAVGPQLSPQFTAGTPVELGQFPDWLNWPAADITWQVTIGTEVVSGTVASAPPAAPLYQALFTPTTPVNPYVYESPVGSAVYTHPASYLHGLFAAMYGMLAGNLPEDNGWHTVQQLAGGNAFGRIFPGEREFNDLLDTIPRSFPPDGGPISPQAYARRPDFAAGMAYLFLKALAPVPVNAPPPPPLPVPKFDFHQAYALLQRHPALLRLFGFVIDLEVPPPAALPATVGLSVTPQWTPQLGAAATTNVMPVTMTTSATWLAEPYDNGPMIAGGLLRLADPGAYDVLEMDVDGTVLKSVNFAQTLTNEVRRTAFSPTSYGVPALRSAGLSLSMTAHAEQVYRNWLRCGHLNAALHGPVTLYAEDIAQGYRIDVWDGTRARWYQLCARSGDPRGINGYRIGNPLTVVPVPDGDEGWIEPVLTAPPGSSSSQVNLPETLLRWDGWSLVAARPGKHLSDASDDGLEGGQQNTPPADAEFQVQIDYAATPGTLPVLRFGRSYRFRARVVDITGNSLPFSKTAPFDNTTDPVVYGRLEPVGSPTIVPCAPRTPGESLETLVIRSNYDIADATVAPCERHLAPPGTSVEMAATHGVLDDAAGGPSKADYAMLAARDGLSYKTPAVLRSYGGKTQSIGQHEWIYYLPNGTFGVPYLPDVLGCGASLFGLPGAGTGAVTVPFGTGWPDRRAVRLVVRAGSGAPALPPAAQADGALTVHAPKASVTTVRLSSWFAPSQLGLLKMWEWISGAGLATPALKELVLDGGHYMLTPYRELTIVHAVRQPLTPPTVHQLTPDRQPGATYANLSGDVLAHPPSTQRVDVLSAYTDPYDDGVSATGTVPLSHQARVAELALEGDASGDITISSMRHDFGDTKHHAVSYSLLATTRFLEYFTVTSDVTLHGTTASAVSAGGFAQGTVVVRGTGADAARTYIAGTDYTENDAQGSVARVAAGGIPDGAVVQVSYAVPPVTRSSLEADAQPPTADGYQVGIPSSQRPPAPDVRYLIPAFGWQRGSSSTSMTSTRIGNTLRVYLGRPWFQTGAGECLGVVVANPAPPSSQFPQDLLPYVSGYGQDPVFAVGAVAQQPQLADFTLASVVGENVLLEEQTEAQPWVGVAGHPVAWDAARGLWYADIAVKPGSSYFPFVKLALVRYQPNSLGGIEVSRVVQADSIQVAPDRAVQLTFPSPTVVQVAVSGPGYLGTTDPQTPDTVQAYVQQATVVTTDADLVWTTVPSLVAGTPLAVVSQTPSQTVWEGSVTLPSARGTSRYRILVAEYEQHAVVTPGNLPSRVTYLDAVEI